MNLIGFSFSLFSFPFFWGVGGLWVWCRTDVLRENTEAVFAACDTAHQRWAKLLGVRVLIHPKLRLQEFLSVYNITQEFMNATEKVFLLYLFSNSCLPASLLNNLC